MLAQVIKRRRVSTYPWVAFRSPQDTTLTMSTRTSNYSPSDSKTCPCRLQNRAQERTTVVHDEVLRTLC